MGLNTDTVSIQILSWTVEWIIGLNWAGRPFSTSASLPHLPRVLRWCFLYDSMGQGNLGPSLTLPYDACLLLHINTTTTTTGGLGQTDDEEISYYKTFTHTHTVDAQGSHESRPRFFPPSPPSPPPPHSSFPSCDPHISTHNCNKLLH